VAEAVTTEMTEPMGVTDGHPLLPARTRGGGPKPAGKNKAAVLLVSLGPERAAEIFKHLRDDEIEELSLEMAKLREVSSDAVDSVFAEVAENAAAYSYFTEGGVAYAKDVLERSLGNDRAQEIIGRLSAVIEMRPFEFLRRTPPEQIHAFLRNEAPQTMALVIANLHTTLAAQVLSLLGETEQAEVALRIARMSETSPDVIKEVETVIRQKLSNVLSQEYASAGGVKSLAEILNNADRPTERNVLENLAQRNQELADEIRALLFVFEDIVKLDDRSVQMVLKSVDTKDLALALRGVGEDVRDKILANMSQRGAEMLLEEMEYMPPQKRAIVEEAQGRIVGEIRRLEETGALVISRGAGEDELVV
jgi:flagellar motor switch protein FliG